jgi:hypothetical protein
MDAAIDDQVQHLCCVSGACSSNEPTLEGIRLREGGGTGQKVGTLTASSSSYLTTYFQGRRAY